MRNFRKNEKYFFNAPDTKRKFYRCRITDCGEAFAIAIVENNGDRMDGSRLYISDFNESEYVKVESPLGKVIETFLLSNEYINRRKKNKNTYEEGYNQAMRQVLKEYGLVV